MATKAALSVPKTVKPYYAEVVAITDAVCTEHLTPEYADLARGLAAALSRKRPSPLLNGKPRTWACGIVYSLGRANFLFDKAQTPSLPAVKLCQLFGVSPSAASAKAKQVEDTLGLRLMDPRCSLPATFDENPLAWFIRVDGEIVDARDAPRHIQEEAFRLGLIPYVPG
jgi:hypothetical protein